MGVITPAITAATTGFVVPGASVYGAGSTASTSTNNLLSDVDKHYANRNGLKFSIFYFAAAANTDTWTSNIPGIVALAWQGADADDDAGVPFLSTPSSGEVTFQMQGTAEGWLWVLHGT